MNSGKLEQVFIDIMEKSYEDLSERDLDLSRIIIPFSKMFKSYKPRDIYSGNEKIPFKERDYKYKMILRQEFSKF